MPLHYANLRNHTFPERTQAYTEKDVMLYALGLGFGADPMDMKQLRFVYEKNLQVLPTMPVVMCHPGQWVKDPKFGVDWLKVVHGEQWMNAHKPLPPKGTVIVRMHNSAVIDKGEGKGAVVIQEREVLDQATGDLLATLGWLLFLRGDGGFLKLPHNASAPVDKAPPSPPPLPDRVPDAVCDIGTSEQQALVYRLSGDMNPLHSDPEVAKAAGYPKPILHGLCTYGIAGHAILKSFCDYEANRLGSLAVRFSAPVYPGETIRTEMWKAGNTVQFRSRLVERDVVVLNNGIATLT